MMQLFLPFLKEVPNDRQKEAEWPFQHLRYDLVGTLGVFAQLIPFRAKACLNLGLFSGEDQNHIAFYITDGGSVAKVARAGHNRRQGR